MAADLPVTAPMQAPDADAKPADDPMIGRKVGAYEVIRRIGQGGMGVVYEARHDKLQQRAAIKCLHQELSQDAKILQRFFNEARAISMSRHSNIVTIYDFGQLEDSTAFILMEFLEGETLLSKMERLQLQRQTLELHVVVELGRQVATAMALIHSKSIVHRDLKPENIFVVPDSVALLGERVKLLDFGIAKFLEGPVRKTTVGMILGTPLYMSPEQCEGAEDLDAKVDVYSLGILLFEMLVGRLPFIADTAAALMRQHMFKEPPHLAAEIKDIPPELDALVNRMLAKRAGDRPAMDEVVDTLEALLAQVAPAKSTTGARRAVSARNRSSQPDTPRPDPYASTIGSPASALGLKSTPPALVGSGALRETPRDAVGAASDPQGLLGSGAFSASGVQQGIGSSASYKSLGGTPISRPAASSASRTDAVVALGRQPLSLIIALVVLLGLGVFGWRILAQQQPPAPPSAQPQPTTQPATAEPKPVEPPVPPPPPVKPPAPPPGDDTRERVDEHSDVKRKPKRHKKAGEPGKADDSDSGSGEPDGKKARAAKAKETGEAWDPDQQ